MRATVKKMLSSPLGTGVRALRRVLCVEAETSTSDSTMTTATIIERGRPSLTKYRCDKCKHWWWEHEASDPQYCPQCGGEIDDVIDKTFDGFVFRKKAKQGDE